MMNDSSANKSLPTVPCAIYTRSATSEASSDKSSGGAGLTTGCTGVTSLPTNEK
jgi:hypothetical protein